jgi:hypothetical protein
MVLKYFASLAAVVAIVTFAASSLPFATRSQVLSGAVMDENLENEFTIDAGNGYSYQINPYMAEFLGLRIGFRTEGPVRVVSAMVDVTPKEVSWTENKQKITATGAALSAHLRWDTPPDSANGAHGLIYFDFPEIPGLEGKTFELHSGRYQKEDGRYVIREVTTYRNGFLLTLGRFLFALPAGLAFGIILHIIGWAFVLKSEKRARLAALPPQGTGLPRTFYPNPIEEWGSSLVGLGIGAFIASMMVGFCVYSGFMSSSFVYFVYGILGVGAALAIIFAYFTRRSVLTVRVESSGLFYARGRGDLQWLSANWSEIMALTERSKTYRGNTTYWLEFEFYDGRKKLKVYKSMDGYSTLRELLSGLYRP